MRILLTTYHQAFLSPAGGETELHQIAEFLNDAGANADIYGPQSKRLSSYDAVLHFSTHGGGEALLMDIRAKGCPIILLPNFNFFDRQHQSKDVVKRHLDLANLIVLRTEAERDLCQTDFSISPEKIVVIPPGISHMFGKKAERGLFQSAYGVEKFVLWVGQLAEHKRQLETINALQDLQYPLVLMGGYTDKKYQEECRKAAGENVRFLPYVQPASEILRSAMQSCSVYLELGDDYPGFSAVEAAVSGAPLVLNDHPWSREIFADAPVYRESGNYDGLSQMLNDFIASERDKPDTAPYETKHLQPAPSIALLDAVSSLLTR